MTHVVTRQCIGCKDMSCANVCPTECFHIGPEMLFIDPENCIDCGGCIPECPVEAIYIDEDVPEQYRSDIELNALMVKKWPRL